MTGPNVTTGAPVPLTWIHTGDPIPTNWDANTPTPAGYHRHEQTTPASVVTINHNLGRWPAAVSLTSIDGAMTFTSFQVQHLDENTLRITIDTPTAYVALIS